MIAGSEGASEREVAQVARALFARGSVREGIAMLRGAVARDDAHEECAGLLARAVRNETIEGPSDTVEIDLGVVDRWIRQGMLVEALALLGGTPMGSLETGREWANLLGELLAPVPVDAEHTLVQMHGQLLSGGASVALTLLEERAKREPGLPAWALRRLEVLRWMLLDNASVAENDPELPSEAPSLLAAELRPHVQKRNLKGALEAARAFSAQDPTNRDALRTIEALEAILTEISRQAGEAAVNSRTIPMYGLPAGAMQLRMGNLAPAASLYRRLVEKAEGDEEEAERMLVEVEALQRALDGRAVVEEADMFGERTQMVAFPDEDTTHDDIAPLPPELVAPELLARDIPEKSGPVPVATVPDARLDDEGPTTEIPSADRLAADLEARGKLVEAEAIYRSMAQTTPGDPQWLRRADAVRAKRLSAESTQGVLVRAIKPVK